MDGTNTLTMTEWISPYIYVGTNPTLEWPALKSNLEGSNPLTMTEWKQPLYLIKWEHIPQSNHNGHVFTSDHVRLHLTIVSERSSVQDQVFLVTHQAAPFQEWK